jgi:TonB family protein
MPIPLGLERPSAPLAPSAVMRALTAPRPALSLPAAELISPLLRALPGSPAPIYSGPVVTSSVTPVYPSEFKSMRLPVKRVEVRVAIDETGHVTSVEALRPKTWTPQGMIQSSLNAARLWKFKPAKRGDQAVPSDTVLEFAFLPVK